MARGKLFSKSVMSKTFNYTNRTQLKLYSDYKRSAKYRGYEFSITFERFRSFWKLPCTYCGCSIPTIGIDRVDSSIGYIENNVLSCCTRCNRMKSSMTLGEFIEQCRRVAEFFHDTNFSNYIKPYR